MSPACCLAAHAQSSSLTSSTAVEVAGAMAVVVCYNHIIAYGSTDRHV
jgi:hypothetical protein